mgnify:FL=1
MAVGRGVTALAWMDTERAGECRCDVHRLDTVKTMVGVVAENTLWIAFLTQPAAINSITIFTFGTVQSTLTNKAKRVGCRLTLNT